MEDVMVVRCKMRCMSLSEEVGNVVGVHAFVARFLPVMPKGVGYPDESEENRAFWSATPSGEAKAQFNGRPENLNVGAFYYIDLVEAADGDDLWKLHEVAQRDGSVKVLFGLSWDVRQTLRSGELELDIRNAATWPVFVGKAGTTWRVTITPAA